MSLTLFFRVDQSHNIMILYLLLIAARVWEVPVAITVWVVLREFYVSSEA